MDPLVAKSFSIVLKQTENTLVEPAYPFDIPILFQPSDATRALVSSVPEHVEGGGKGQVEGEGSGLAPISEKVIEALVVLVIRRADRNFFTYCNTTDLDEYAFPYKLIFVSLLLIIYLV